MATYAEWNRAIALNAIHDRPPRSPIYLNIDSDILDEIGAALPISASSCELDFLNAVRSSCLYVNDYGQERVNSGLLSRWTNGPGDRNSFPNVVGFLALTVLAASRMGEDADLDHKAYFPVVRELLGGMPATHSQQARPPGWDLGDERDWWANWQVWLSKQGFVATYRYGEGPRKYIDLPISQTLLRRTDEERLLRLFDYHGEFARDMTDREVMRRVQRYVAVLTVQLRHLFSDRDRRNEVTNDIFTLHADWRGGARTAGVVRPRHAFSTTYLVRTTDFFDGVTYSARVTGPDAPNLPTITPQLLNGGWEGTHDGRRLRLPRRDIWVFAMSDEALPNVMTSVTQPPASVPITILARRAHAAQLRRAEEMKLLQWRGRWDRLPEPFDGWIELDQCRVVPGNWPDDIVADSLRPRERLKIAFTQGMSIGERFVWLEGHLPRFTIHAGSSSGISRAQLQAITDNGIKELATYSVEIGAETALPVLAPGLYRLTCVPSGQTDSSDTTYRDFEICSPRSLGLGDLDRSVAIQMAGAHVFGSYIIDQ